MDMASVLATIQADARCVALPAAGMPEITEGHRLPEDLQHFYQLCGGLAMFRGSRAPTYIVPPQGLVLANPVIVGEVAEYDISSSWYIIASDGTDSQRVTIDLSLERLGRCYDSFWDRHAVAGSSTIIALSFTEFLSRTHLSNGEELYWLRPDFAPLGDAYD